VYTVRIVRLYELWTVSVSVKTDSLRWVEHHRVPSAMLGPLWGELQTVVTNT